MLDYKGIRTLLEMLSAEFNFQSEISISLKLMDKVALSWILFFQQHCISTTVLPLQVIFFAH